MDMHEEKDRKKYEILSMQVDKTINDAFKSVKKGSRQNQNQAKTKVRTMQ